MLYCKRCHPNSHSFTIHILDSWAVPTARTGGQAFHVRGPLSWHHRRLATFADPAGRVAIHENAARWLWDRGIRQWRLGTLLIEWMYEAIAWGNCTPRARKARWGEAGYIHGLRVRRSAAVRGIGLAQRWAEREIAVLGMLLARLERMAKNPALCAYYERVGYRRVGSFTFHTGDELFPVALFEKTLDAI